MKEQWQELKETITELRDNDGTGTQQEVCKFLANLMDELEKQMSSSEKPNKWIDAEVLDKIRAELHATAVMHQDGGYYVRDEWIDEIFDKYKASTTGAEEENND